MSPLDLSTLSLATRQLIEKKRQEKDARRLLALLTGAERVAIDAQLKPIIQAMVKGDKVALQRALKALDEELGEPLADAILASSRAVLNTSYRSGTTEILVTRAWRLNQTDRRAMEWLAKDFTYWVGQYHGDSVSRTLREALEPALADGLTRAKAAKLLAEALAPVAARSRAYWENLANHVTTRARTFGQVEGLVRAGATHYRIVAVLDHRTSPVCRVMHGKTFAVAQAVKLRDRLMAAKDPEAVKAISPWLREAQIEKLSATALARRGFCLPPFHFACRTTLQIWVSKSVAPRPGWLGRIRRAA